VLLVPYPELPDAERDRVRQLADHQAVHTVADRVTVHDAEPLAHVDGHLHACHATVPATERRAAWYTSTVCAPSRLPTFLTSTCTGMVRPSQRVGTVAAAARARPVEKTSRRRPPVSCAGACAGECVKLGVAEPVSEREDRRAHAVEAVGPAGVPARRVGTHRHVLHRRLLQVVLGVRGTMSSAASRLQQITIKISNYKRLPVAKSCYSLPRCNIHT
jgi:hypothetical protein